MRPKLFAITCSKLTAQPKNPKAIQNLSVFKYGAQKHFFGKLKSEGKDFIIIICCYSLIMLFILQLYISTGL